VPTATPDDSAQTEEAWYSYAIVRVVPEVARGEFINVGVILYVRTMQFLEARIHLDEERLRSLAPRLEAFELREHLHTYSAIARGDPDAGPIASFNQSERFHWLTSPRSTMIQTSPVHVGCCADPEAVLDDLMDRLVL